MRTRDLFLVAQLPLVALLPSADAAPTGYNPYSYSYGSGKSRLEIHFARRSTFSMGDEDPYPQGVDYLNFKVNSSAGEILYASPLGPNVPYSLEVSTVFSELESTANVTTKPYLLGTVIPAPEDCSTDLQSILDSFKSDDVWSEAFAKNVFLAPGSCGVSWAHAVLGKRSPATGYNVTANSTTWGSWNATSNSTNSTNSTTVSPAADINEFTSITVLDNSAYSAGPYLILSTDPTKLYPVYRLYSDPQYAFTEGFLPESIPANISDAKYVQAPTGGQGGWVASGVSIPAPSRLYFGLPTVEQPLLGKRVAVKDIYDIAGLRTGCGNRAYYSLYDPASTSSYPIKKLLMKGAVIIGKTKTSQFANGESPTADWVDQLCPFNPRGEGYQSPSSSSAGSAAGLAAYDWLDYAIGSDTGGSIRNPAGLNGLFAIRPSWGAISLEGVMPLADPLDTAGCLARDASELKTFGAAWYEDSFTGGNATVGSPTEILAPADFWKSILTTSGEPAPGPLKEAGKIYAAFISDLAKFLSPPFTNSTTVNTTISNVTIGNWTASNSTFGKNRTLYWNTTSGFQWSNSTSMNSTFGGWNSSVTNYTSANFTVTNVTSANITNITSGVVVDYETFAAKWGNAAVVNETLDSYLNLTYPLLIGEYQYTHLGEQFFADYRKKNDGSDPFVDPIVQSRWGWASQQPNGSYDEQVTRKDVFADFLDSDVFKSGSSSCSSSILVYPQQAGIPVYRNLYTPITGPPFGFSANRVAVFGGSPEVVVTIGDVAYNSTIAHTTNYRLPVSISIVAKRGCDLELLDLVQQLQDAGVVKSVMTGPSAF